MKSYRSWERKHGRTFVAISPWAINLPRLILSVDGDAVNVGFSFGNGSSDPVLLADIDLSGTRIGSWLSEAYWWITERVQRYYAERGIKAPGGAS